MFKLILKHYLTDFAVGLLFERVTKNFKRPIIDSMVGYYVNIIITEECRRSHNFSTCYLHGVLHSVDSNDFKILLTSIDSVMIHYVYLRSSEILDIQKT